LDELKKRRFLRGVTLSRAPSVPALIDLSNVLRGMSRATRLVAVAGGLAQMFAVWMGAILIGQATAILLLRVFSPGDWMQIPVLSICMSGLMLLFIGLFLWSTWFPTHHTF
jgi:hypothetical protein